MYPNALHFFYSQTFTLTSCSVFAVVPQIYRTKPGAIVGERLIDPTIPNMRLSGPKLRLEIGLATNWARMFIELTD